MAVAPRKIVRRKEVGPVNALVVHARTQTISCHGHNKDRGVG